MKCPHCFGYGRQTVQGWTGGSWFETCHVCGGTGRVSWLRTVLVPRLRAAAEWLWGGL